MTWLIKVHIFLLHFMHSITVMQEASSSESKWAWGEVYDTFESFV